MPGQTTPPTPEKCASVCGTPRSIHERYPDDFDHPFEREVRTRETADLRTALERLVDADDLTVDEYRAKWGDVDALVPARAILDGAVATPTRETADLRGFVKDVTEWADAPDDLRQAARAILDGAVATEAGQ